MAFGEKSVRRRKETQISREFLETLLLPFLKSTTVGEVAVLDLPDIIKVKYIKVKQKRSGTQLRKRE